jgi:hypothetical protein
MCGLYSSGLRLGQVAGSRVHVNLIKPSGKHMYHLLKHLVTLHSANRVHLCVSYDSQCKE